MKPGRRIAFDYGTVRIGVAASDATGLIASPIATLLQEDPQLDTRIKQILDDYEPIYLVVGEPKHLSGHESATQSSVHSFIELLKTLTDLPIHVVDERMSTVHAARSLRESGVSAKESKSKIDAMAAVVILENALARERLAGEL